MGTAKAGSLTPMELARRCQERGARVEFKDSRYRIYPPDQSLSPIFVADRFGDNRARLNAIAQLRRSGLDILADHEQETPLMATPGPTPAVLNGKPKQPTVAALEQQIRDLLELATETDSARRAEIEQLQARVDNLEERLAATPGAPPAKDPNAELDAAILTLMNAAPINLTAGVIAANLAVEAGSDLVSARLQVLAGAGKVVEGPNRVYHLPVSVPRA